jgi:cytochrome c oxidase subunit 2
VTQRCGLCHTISGTEALGTVGPDLTHLAARGAIAAGTIANTRDNLLAWIVAPETIKPGTQMPGTPLDGDALLALVTYLETLQ